MVKKRHKKLLKQAKGFWGQRKNIFKRAKETLLRAMAFAFKSRKLRKRDFRSLFITRISAACKGYEVSYSRFMHSLKTLDVMLNRKMLSQLAALDPQAFGAVMTMAKKQIS